MKVTMPKFFFFFSVFSTLAAFYKYLPSVYEQKYPQMQVDTYIHM